MAVGIYLRVSTEEQRERQTIATQRDFGTRFAGLHQLPVHAEYSDDGVSGTVPLDRPADDVSKSRLAFPYPAEGLMCGGGERNPLKHDQSHLDAIPATRPLAVGYVRVAAVSHTHPRSGLDAQIATIRAFTKAEGIELVRVFEDAGQSAHNRWRPGLLALMPAVGAGHASLIIVPDLTRLARDLGDLRRLMDSFARRGVRLVSANVPRGF